MIILLHPSINSLKFNHDSIVRTLVLKEFRAIHFQLVREYQPITNIHILLFTDYSPTHMSQFNRIQILKQHIQPTTVDQVSFANTSSSSNFPNYSQQFASQQQSTSRMSDNNNQSIFGNIPVAPRDPILGLTQAFKEDTSPNKVNVGVGAYRTEEGKPWVLRVVREVEKKLVEQSLDKEYIPQDGLAAFNEVSPKLLLGFDSRAIKEKRVVSCQSISGTGALRIATEFIKDFLPANTTVYLPDPTWGNHFKILDKVGVPRKNYKYLNKKELTLDLQGVLQDMENAPDGSVFLLHVCAHNPTGVDPTIDQWREIAKVMQRKRHFPFFDCAYQGFASGDLDRDAASVRLFVDEFGMEVFACQSYAKNFGLYGERIGALVFVSNNPQTAEAILSQLKSIVRANYSSPPLQGARVVATALADPQLFKLWKEDLVIMAERIKEMRKQLFAALKKRNTPGNWDHIVNQIGMFSFTGLSPAQVDRMTKKHHIYMTSDGRISMSGLNTKVMNYFADAMDEVVRNG
jgi:aspartate/tyrosine/aromatic aminotransferase